MVPFPAAPPGKWMLVADVTPSGESNVHRSARNVSAN
jgi:hypothetical protein